MQTLILAITGLSFFFWGSNNADACQAHVQSYGNQLVQSSIYNPKEKSLGTIIIMPPTGGANFLDQRYASSLCRAGFQAIIITGWLGMDEESLELSVHQRLLQRGQNAITEVVNTLTEAPFVGILGTSVGALHGMTALGSKDQIAAGFFIAGGVPFSRVIGESTQKELATYRKMRMDKLGYKDLYSYSKALSQAIHPELEPLTYQQSLLKKPMGFILAQDDHTVPTYLQLKAVESFNPQPFIEIDAGHMWAIIKAWWFYEETIVDFFLKSARSS